MRGTRSLPIGKLARILAGTWLFEAVLALVVALPVRAIVDRAYGSHPDGDAVLFKPGALELTELVYRFDPAMSAVPVLILVTLLIAAIVGHVPLGASLGSLLGKHAVVSRSMRVLPRMLGTFLIFGVLKIAIIAGACFFAFRVNNALTDSHGEVRAFMWGAGSTLPFLLVLVIVSVFQDYVYAALVRDARVLMAFKSARSAFRASRLGPILHWLARNVASLLVLLVGASIAGALGGRSGAALVVLFLAHQVVQLTRIYLRVSWLAYVVERFRIRATSAAAEKSLETVVTDR